MICKTCGGNMEGDGYQMVFHCENINIFENTPEPDSNPLYCSEIEWLNIEDCLPDNHQMVLVYADWSGEKRVTWDSAACKWIDDEGVTYHCHMFTHWKPQP